MDNSVGTKPCWYKCNLLHRVSCTAVDTILVKAYNLYLGGEWAVIHMVAPIVLFYKKKDVSPQKSPKKHLMCVPLPKKFRHQSY